MDREHGRERWLAAALLAAACCSAGCVERRYTIRTEPPGALVVVNDEEIGPAAPAVSRSFTFYGDRDITLYLDGYETQHIIQPIPAPWYDNLLTEFFSENLVPITIRDEREFVYQMQPQQSPALGDLLNRAQAVRQQGSIAPPPRRGGILGFFGVP